VTPPAGPDVGSPADPPVPPHTDPPPGSALATWTARLTAVLHRLGHHRTVVAVATIFGVLTGTWWLGERVGLVGPSAPPRELVAAAEARLLADERSRAADERQKADAETIRALREAVVALAAKSGPGVREALEALSRGDRSRAEALFAEVGQRKAAEGAAANREAAEAFRHLGALAAGQDTNRALAAYRRAAELDPDDAWTWIRIAHLEQRAGDLAAAEQAAERARAAAPRTTNDHDRMWSLVMLGDIRRAGRELATAGRAFAEARSIAEDLVKKDPANTEWQRDLSVSHVKIGDVLVAQGDGAGALEAFRKALAIREALVKKDPANTEWQRDLIVSNVKLAELAADEGATAEARTRYGEALRIARELASAGRLAPVDAWMPAELERRLAALPP
jgi:tetratricopeptide (TPR) repeat protein